MDNTLLYVAIKIFSGKANNLGAEGREIGKIRLYHDSRIWNLSFGCLLTGYGINMRFVKKKLKVEERISF